MKHQIADDAMAAFISPIAYNRPNICNQETKQSITVEVKTPIGGDGQDWRLNIIIVKNGSIEEKDRWLD